MLQLILGEVNQMYAIAIRTGELGLLATAAGTTRWTREIQFCVFVNKFLVVFVHLC
jgi:hypothetical protein